MGIENYLYMHVSAADRYKRMPRQSVLCINSSLMLFRTKTGQPPSIVNNKVKGEGCECKRFTVFSKVN